MHRIARRYSQRVRLCVSVSNVSPVSAGYGDMYLLIRNMVAANYDGSIILDHTPSFEEFAGGKYS
jgi:hypothetical protein